MKAVTISEFGAAGVLRITEVTTPDVGANEVRIDVVGAGLNGADLAQRRGSYPPPADAPAWPGLEASGIISVVGASVTNFAVGDAVCALLPGGGYAERVVVDAGLVLPEVAATVWSNIFMLAQLQAGETLLMHGGSSGIGTMAIQLATALGSQVISTAGSPEKVAVIEALGAAGINYRAEDFVDRVAAITGGRGADVILDLVGGEYLARNIRALAVGGRIMVISNRDGRESTVNLGRLMAKRGRIWGTTLRSRPLAERVEIIAAVRENVWPLIEAGRVKPIIDSVFELEDAAAAHERMESSAHIGKILLRVG